MDDSEIKYQASIDLSQRNSSHTLLHEMVDALGGGRDVLEVGCSSGYLGASLRRHGHRVTGVEPDAASASAARAVLDAVHHGTADGYLAAQPDARFDAIVLGDVLEHMADPGAALAACAERLRPGGAIALSLPNATHGSVRAMLLGGRWDYAEQGILDRTHMRFFSREGIADLLARAGLRAERWQATILATDEAADRYGSALDSQLVTLVELVGDGSQDIFQHVVLAKPDPDAGAATLLAHNLALPVERMAPRSWEPPTKRLSQRMRLNLFRSALAELDRRRNRLR